MLEESADFSELQGFFANNHIKRLVNVIIKHYSQLVKKQIVKQREAEILIQGAVINFDCSTVESKLISQCIIDTLTRAIAAEPKAESRKGDYNSQLNLNDKNQQMFVPQRSKLHSNTASTAKKGANQPQLAEFD